MFVQRYNFFCEKLAGIRGMLYLCTAIRKGALSSAGSERLPYKQRVGGSNPSAPTKQGAGLDGLAPCFFACPRSALPASRPCPATSERGSRLSRCQRDPPPPNATLLKYLYLIAQIPVPNCSNTRVAFQRGTVAPYSSPSSRLMSCSSARMDCRRPMISDVSLAALWFLFRTAFAAAIFMPRTLSRL